MRLALSQNYFTFQNKVYQPEKGVYVGSTILSTTAEIFIQYFEDIHIKHLLDTKNILFYIPYVDDTLIIYDTKITHPDLINTHINQIHTNVKLIPTYENNRCISLLDLLIIQKPSNLETDIFHKPATTDTNINFFSNHPIEQNCCFQIPHYQNTLPPINTKEKTKEWTLIQLIAQNNNFPQNLLQKLNHQIQHKKKKPTRNKPMEKTKNKTRTTFAYCSPKIRNITNLFKHINVGISFKITNTLQQITKPKIDSSVQEQDESRIYELTCNTCHMSYIRQTNHSLKQRYQKHIRYIKHNEPQFA